MRGHIFTPRSQPTDELHAEEDILEAENDHNSSDDVIRDKHEEILAESRSKMAELNAEHGSGSGKSS